MGVNSLVGVPCEKKLADTREQLRLTHIDWVNTQAELTAAQARIEKLERMVVWAVKHGAEVEGDRMWWFRMLGEDSGDVSADCDGTPASILAAVQQAMKAGAKEGE